MAPKIKFYVVPSGFQGITHGELQASGSLADIVLDEEVQQLFPIELAEDLVNGIAGEAEEHEIAFINKIKLTESSGIYYAGSLTGQEDLAGKRWLKSWGYEPLIFVQNQVQYFDEETHQCEYVPPTNIHGEANYEIGLSGVTFASGLKDDYPQFFVGSTMKNVYAVFYYYNDIDYAHPATSPVSGYYAAYEDDYVGFTDYVMYSGENIGGNVDWTPISSFGVFNKDAGIIQSPYSLSGMYYGVSGYRHTWQRISNSDQHSLRFSPGECLNSYTTIYNPTLAQLNEIYPTRRVLVKDLTTYGAWYEYVDIKIVNESIDSPLEKLFIQASLRGNLDENEIIEGWGGLVNQSRPWDVQTGTAKETCGYDSAFVFNDIFNVLVWEDSFCFASGLTGIGVDGHYLERIRFPTPLRWFDLVPIFTFYTSTPIVEGSYTTPAFVQSSDVSYSALTNNNEYPQVDISGQATANHNRYLLNQSTSTGDYMILPSGQFDITSNPAFPHPGTIYCRLLRTYRNFNNNLSVADFYSLNDTPFTDIDETSGGKSWTLQVVGDYYR